MDNSVTINCQTAHVTGAVPYRAYINYREELLLCKVCAANAIAIQFAGVTYNA